MERTPRRASGARKVRSQASRRSFLLRVVGHERRTWADLSDYYLPLLHKARMEPLVDSATTVAEAGAYRSWCVEPRDGGTMRRAIMFLAALVLAAATAAAAPQPAGHSSSAATPPWPDRVRLVASGDVVYPDRDSRTVHVEFDVVFVRAEAPDPAIPGAWYVPAAKSVVREDARSPSQTIAWTLSPVAD